MHEQRVICLALQRSGAGVHQQISALHLYELVSALQAVPQSPALGLLVVFVVLPESLGLLLLLLLLPQLLPRVLELSRQRRNHAVVSLLLLLVASGERTHVEQPSYSSQQFNLQTRHCILTVGGGWNLTEAINNLTCTMSWYSCSAVVSLVTS